MNTHEKEHKELRNKIWNCECSPFKEGYCKDCKDAVIKFMENYGSGALTNDLKIEELENKNSKLENENKSLNQKLQNKIKQVEELRDSADNHRKK